MVYGIGADSIEPGYTNQYILSHYQRALWLPHMTANTKAWLPNSIPKPFLSFHVPTSWKLKRSTRLLTPCTSALARLPLSQQLQGNSQLLKLFNRERLTGPPPERQAPTHTAAYHYAGRNGCWRGQSLGHSRYFAPSRAASHRMTRICTWYAIERTREYKSWILQYKNILHRIVSTLCDRTCSLYSLKYQYFGSSCSS